MDSYDEFLDDFGSTGLTDAELAQLLARARSTNDRELRLLIKQYRALRRAAGWVLESLEEGSDVAGIRTAEPTRLLRFLVMPPGSGTEHP